MSASVAAAVLALHTEHVHKVRFTRGLLRGETKHTVSYCSHCTDTGDFMHTVSDAWPCPTVAAVRAAMDADLLAAPW